jgi:hypothetical protein
MAFQLCYIHFTMQNEQFNYIEWKRLPRGDVAPHWSGLYVTMNKKGGLVLSGVTHERLGSPTAYRIDLDQINQRMRLQPSGIGHKDAYPARVQGRGGAKIIRAYRLITYFGIRPPDTIEFIEPKIDLDGNLVVNLRNIRISPKAHSQCRKDEKHQDR